MMPWHDFNLLAKTFLRARPLWGPGFHWDPEHAGYDPGEHAGYGHAGCGPGEHAGYDPREMTPGDKKYRFSKSLGMAWPGVENVGVPRGSIFKLSRGAQLPYKKIRIFGPIY